MKMPLIKSLIACVALSAAAMAPGMSSAATITFENLRVAGGTSEGTQTEDGMRYVLASNFVVYPFEGNPPSSLIGSPIVGSPAPNLPTVITRVNSRNFTFDAFDAASFGPGTQSDTWLFRGLLDGVEQFAFSVSTNTGFVTRTTNLNNSIDRLELLITAGSASGLVVDNLRFTVPEPGSSAMVLLGVILIGGLRMRRRQ